MTATAHHHPWVEHAERLDRMLEPFTPSLLDGLAPGDRVLDIGCGGGATTIAAARLVGPDGHVTGLDPEPALLELARRRAEAAGVAVELVESRFEDHHPPAPVDRAIARCSLMHLPHTGDELARLATAIAPDGSLRAVVWAEPWANEWSALPLQVLADHGIGGGPLGFTGPFSLADADRLRAELDAAGFVDVSVLRVETSVWVAADPGDAVAFFADHSHGVLDMLPTDVRLAVTEDMTGRLERRRAHDGIRLAAAALTVSARTPAVRR